MFVKRSRHLHQAQVLVRTARSNLLALGDCFAKRRLAVTLTNMDAEIAALEVELSKRRQVKQGMMSELLTGG